MMSRLSPAVPTKKKLFPEITCIHNSSEQNSTNDRLFQNQQARTFITWYKHMVDNERQNLGLYLSDNATLQWFGKTIKPKKKICAFLKYDMQCSRHDFITVYNIEKIQLREPSTKRKDDAELASPFASEDFPKAFTVGRKRLLRSNCNSPEWADESGHAERISSPITKRHKSDHNYIETKYDTLEEDNIKPIAKVLSLEMDDKGDVMVTAENPNKSKFMPVTPPFRELGQGDCLPSTSGREGEKSHDVLYAQLPKLSVECKGFVEFTRTKSNHTVDTMKWERKCKVQITYSLDPLNVGEYVIWGIYYSDESKCRRNLMAAFEEVAKQEESK